MNHENALSKSGQKPRLIQRTPGVNPKPSPIQNHWEPKLVEATPLFLEEKEYQSLLAELTEILYLHFARQGQNSNVAVPTEAVSEPSKEEAWE